MSHPLRLVAVAFGAGVVFGIGLAVSGMTRPEKVLGFLDVTGRWDPTLACVMGGAVVVHFVAYRWARGRTPWHAPRFFVPAGMPIDMRLCVGALLFGIGWGLGGYCPGPAIVSLATASSKVLVFVLAMLAGMWLVRPALAAAPAEPKPRRDAAGSSLQ